MHAREQQVYAHMVKIYIVAATCLSEVQCVLPQQALLVPPLACLLLRQMCTKQKHICPGSREQ